MLVLQLCFALSAAVVFPNEVFNAGDDDKFRAEFEVDVRIERFNNQEKASMFPIIPILPGEGVVTEELLAIRRHGHGVIFNAAIRNTDHFIQASPEQKPLFLHEIIKAAKASARIKSALRLTGNDTFLQTMLFTNAATWKFAINHKLCNEDMPGPCAEFHQLGGAAVFDMVRFYDALDIPKVVDTYPDSFQQWPWLWLSRIIAYLHTPFAMTMGFDSDVYVCEGFERLFNYLDNHHLFAATFDPPFYGIQGRFRVFMRDDFPDIYKYFPERNAGMILMNTQFPNTIKLLALWRDVYLRHVNDPVLITYVLGDQPALREALFTIRPLIHDRVIPLGIGCRWTDYGRTETFHAMCSETCLTAHRRESFEGHTDSQGNFLTSELGRKKKTKKTTGN